MKPLGFYARELWPLLANLALALVVAACGGPVVPLRGSESTASEVRTATSYQTLYSFKGDPDAASPFAGLISDGTKLYGTASTGGRGPAQGGCGAVFDLTASFSEHVLYSFRCNTGIFPTDRLIASGGELYGTTEGGGNFSDGTVFSLTKSGKEHVLYNFRGGNDGARPYGGLINVDGKFYGTTQEGGNYGQGAVFIMTPAGHEHLVHSFGRAPDGGDPVAGLTAVNGVLYGTTSEGGAYGYGTIFRVTTKGNERVLHSFQVGGLEGWAPSTELTEHAGQLYGTTSTGGQYGFGTVFQIDTAGHLSVLYSFGSHANDGYMSTSPVTFSGNTLYGVMGAGGTLQGGILYSITGNSERVLHNFGRGSDGSYPNGRLLIVGHLLAGTTQYGGKQGYGTVFGWRL
jgi:uncharacterized repeat protein (TIGR03803 family)